MKTNNGVVFFLLLFILRRINFCIYICLCMQEDERRRREKEERMAREEDFLRSSLRGSRKLQALEEKGGSGAKSVSGVVNIAYTGRDEEDEGDDATDPGFANKAGLANWASALAQQNNYLLNSGMQKIIGMLSFLHLYR